ncbi:phosphotriesterase family protein [Enterocloster bolteae]|uniref:phosphotriesterase family protein n=1 Tax=Enterocloster bolteae TaxID=208479 RepID=UPI00210DE42A|nr:phosphotriesterase-related protein [Enterocloster bolteae]MCQ5145799.1 phosphotriesterase-related protein [Enterocloster bolteae]
MGKMINTVLGPIEAKDLGKTLMHEHLIYGFCGFQGDYTLGGFDELLCIRENMKWLTPLKEKYGFRTIVDATNNECGRDPFFLAKMATIMDLNIICSTGFYYEPASAFMYWKFRSGFADVETEMYEMMRTELTKGIGNTGIKAGVIKLASSANQITPFEEKFFRAAARNNRETGATIITHTEAGTMGPEQAKLLIDNGANPKDIAIGHMCGNTDLDYHERVLQYGVFDSFDRFGLEGDLFNTPTDEERCDVIAALLDKGYEDQILMSHDSVTVELGRPRPVPKDDLHFMAHANILNIPDRVIPMLKERGVTDAQLDKIFIANPAKVLG